MNNYPDKTSSGMTIGSLADAAAINLETIRFYQRKGLMPEPVRAPGSVRRYGEPALARVRFIKSAQRLGFSLEEVAHLLKLEDGTHCTEARILAEQKLMDVSDKLADLQRIELVLRQLVKRCGSASGAVKCPIIESLQQSKTELICLGRYIHLWCGKSLLTRIREKQLFAIDFVTRNHALPCGRRDPIDKLLRACHLRL